MKMPKLSVVASVAKNFWPSPVRQHLYSCMQLELPLKKHKQLQGQHPLNQTHRNSRTRRRMHHKHHVLVSLALFLQKNYLLTDFVDFVSPRSPASQDASSPGQLDVFDGKMLMNSHGKAKSDDEDGPSAADYDPVADMQEDEMRDELRHGQVVVHGEPHAINTAVLDSKETDASEIPSQNPNEKSEGDEDDDDFDMFAENFDEEKYATKAAEPMTGLEAIDGAPDALANDKGGILEGDDKDGYYKFRVGELFNGRYQIQATLGRGMFSGVARAVDVTTKKLVAIKIMRNNDALRKGGYTEIAILQKLNDADPENRKHIVQFDRSFDYKGHLCMTFENLSLNLREVLRKFGNNVGINLTATRAYAYQCFVALAHMRKCSVIHADLKPDNILVCLHPN